MRVITSKQKGTLPPSGGGLTGRPLELRSQIPFRGEKGERGKNQRKKGEDYHRNHLTLRKGGAAFFSVFSGEKERFDPRGEKSGAGKGKEVVGWWRKKLGDPRPRMGGALLGHYERGRQRRSAGKGGRSGVPSYLYWRKSLLLHRGNPPKIGTTRGGEGGVF